MSGFRIESIHAFVAVDPDDGDEGIPAFVGEGGIWMPLIAANLERLQDLRPIAESMAKTAGLTLRLVRFTTRTELDIIEPGP